MRKPRSGAAALSLLAVLLMASAPSVSAHSGHVFSARAYVAPTIDGELSHGEWADAQSITALTTGCGLTPPEITVYVKNDETYLYMALVVRGAVEANSPAIEFDNLHDGVRNPGDNVWRQYDGVLGFNVLNRLVHVGDTFRGGTDDVQFATSNNGEEYRFEFAGLLDSEDDENDFSLAPGDTVGFHVSFREGNSPCFPPGYIRWWPGKPLNTTSPEDADLVVASTDDAGEVCLCHRPPADPEYGELVCVEPDEVATHLLSHDDDLGPCRIEEDARLEASDGGPDREFGSDVAVCGDTVVVGAPDDDDAGEDSGSAYVFVKPTGDPPSVLTESAKLLPSDGVARDRFGLSVSVSGDTAVVVGGWNSVTPGRAYVFERPAGGWNGTVIESARLVASDAASLGRAVSVSGDTVVVGTVDTEAAYVFVQPPGGWRGTLIESARLVTSDGMTSQLGLSVSVSDDTVVLGQRWGGADSNVYVYVKPGGGWGGTLTESARLASSDTSGGQFFGRSVSISGDVVVVGAPNDEDRSGSAYVFVKPDGGWAGDLRESAKLRASDGASGDSFGGFLDAITGNKAVSVTRNSIVVGALHDDDNGFSSGSAYFFVKPPRGWAGTLHETVKLLPSDGAQGDLFGESVFVSGGTAVVGAYRSDAGGDDSGSAYLFELNGPPVALCADVTVPAGASGCTANASVDDGSYDPDGDDLTLTQEPAGPLGLGETLVTLTVEDGAGASASCEATVTVVDTTPPEIDIGLAPAVLWPPDHRLVEVEASVGATDACGPVTVELESITSSEPGGKTEDVLGADPGRADRSFELRAERAGSGSGRIYTVVYTATDGSGNRTAASATVVVPHDLGKDGVAGETRRRGGKP